MISHLMNVCRISLFYKKRLFVDFSIVLLCKYDILFDIESMYRKF